MVAWETSPKGICLKGTMVPCTGSSDDTQEVPATVARHDVGSSSTVPHSVLQDGLHQACCSFGHPVQSQTGHRRLVNFQLSRLLL